MCPPARKICELNSRRCGIDVIDNLRFWWKWFQSLFEIAIDLSAAEMSFECSLPHASQVHSNTRIFPFISIRSSVQLSDDIFFWFQSMWFDLLDSIFLTNDDEFFLFFSKTEVIIARATIYHQNSSMSRLECFFLSSDIFISSAFTHY